MVDVTLGYGRVAINRRRALMRAGASTVLGVVPSSIARASNRPIRIGYVSPQTGPLALMAEADDFVLGGVREAMKDGVSNPSGQYPIEIIVKDSQSDPNSAAQAAAELILQDDIDLMVVGASPGNANPVSDQCEINGVPCVSTMAPWQPWFFGRGGDPAMGFQWTYHYFWGLEDVINVFIGIWDQVPTNKTVGLFLPDDGDGNAWGDPQNGLPPTLTQKGYKIIDPGRFQPLQSDFNEQVSAFKNASVDIVCGVPISTDFKNFWNLARQAALRAKRRLSSLSRRASVARARSMASHVRSATSSASDMSIADQ